MFPPFQPLQLLLVIFAGWVNRHQLGVIEYSQEENRVLKEHLGGRRIRLTDTERRRLARRARTLGRKVLTERNHQDLENRLPQPGSITALPHHPVQRRQRLGGMLSYYHRAAA
jgi:hypothetical protein